MFFPAPPPHYEMSLERRKKNTFGHEPDIFARILDREVLELSQIVCLISLQNYQTFYMNYKLSTPMLLLILLIVEDMLPFRTQAMILLLQMLIRVKVQCQRFGQKKANKRLRIMKNSLHVTVIINCLLYTSPSPRDKRQSRMPSSA